MRLFGKVRKRSLWGTAALKTGADEYDERKIKGDRPWLVNRRLSWSAWRLQRMSSLSIITPKKFERCSAHSPNWHLTNRE
jgi:hypothetical protein